MGDDYHPKTEIVEPVARAAPEPEGAPQPFHVIVVTSTPNNAPYVVISFQFFSPII
jgi:hypothetical protein